MVPENCFTTERDVNKSQQQNRMKKKTYSLLKIGVSSEADALTVENATFTKLQAIFIDRDLMNEAAI